MSGWDTTTFFEFRPNLNVFQQGKFTNTFTAGIGYILNAKENLLTELTSGIEYAYSPQIHFNVYFGQYYYSGRYSDSNSTFFGISCMYYFSPNNSKPLITNGSNKVSGKITDIYYHLSTTSFCVPTTLLFSSRMLT